MLNVFYDNLLVPFNRANEIFFSYKLCTNQLSSHEFNKGIANCIVSYQSNLPSFQKELLKALISLS